ncbi:aldose 1-epimerase family protein [Coraliomargarita sp. W4R72]
MKTLYKLPLLAPQSSEGFKAIQLKGESPANWSVNTYTLRGGLQEGVQVVEINNGKLSFAVLPTRGMGIWKGQCGDISLGWDSPVKDPVNPVFVNQQERGGIGWLKGFNEWIVRCGLNSMGAPCTDTVLDYSGNPFDVSLTLHGNIANIPARSVSIEITDEAIILKGEVDETMMFGPALRLNTEIRTELGSGALTITDTVTNLGNNPTEHQLLYHVNYGAPLLEKGARILAPYKQVAPRDPRAAEGIETLDTYTAPEIGFVEQGYYYELAGKRGSRETMTMLRNAAGNQAALLRFSLKDFPCFTLWKNPAGKADGYVTGMEPATSYPNSRLFEREKGRVLNLAGGESRSTTLTVETLDTKKAISAAAAEIKQIQKTTKAKIHPQPIPQFSDIS